MEKGSGAHAVGSVFSLICELSRADGCKLLCLKSATFSATKNYDSGSLRKSMLEFRRNLLGLGFVNFSTRVEFGQ